MPDGGYASNYQSNVVYNNASNKDEIWCQYYIYNYDYYGNNTYDFDSGADYYTTLKNVIAMEQEAVASGGAAINPYEAMGKFFRAYFFQQNEFRQGRYPNDPGFTGYS